MKGRSIPLWLAFVPLALGVLAWAMLWRGYAAGLKAELRAVLPAGTMIETGGFPYRLEARIADLTLRQESGALQAMLRTSELVLNRVPWQRDRQVLVAFDPEMRLAVPALPGVFFEATAPAAQASLHLDQGSIVRLSIVWPSGVGIRSGLLPVDARAGHFEAHLRETPAEESTGESAGESADAAAGELPPTQAQIVLSGRELRFGDGAPLQLALDAELVAKAPLRSLGAWRHGGAVSITDALLSDSGGEVARFRGTIRPDGDGLFLDGEIDTFCPATVRAAVAGERPAVEKRARRIQTLAISGRFPGGLAIPPRDESRPLPPVRGQEADCPLLR